MAGIFGVVSKEDCVEDLFKGTFYLQHRAQKYCGFGFIDNKGKPYNFTRHGLITVPQTKERILDLKTNTAIGCVTGERQPVSDLSKMGGVIIGFDGNLINHEELKLDLLKEGVTFSGYNNPEEITDNVLVSKIITREKGFEKGIERLFDTIKGDFSIVCLAAEGIYAARGYGRKPLILGSKDGSYAVSSESNSFINSRIKIVRDVKPGEVVLMNHEGIHEVKQFDVDVKYGTFEWIYTSHPASIVDGKSVSEVRKKIGALLHKRFPVEADIVSPLPNSGRWHSTGYAHESKIPHEEAFVRYDYSDRSFTQMNLIEQQREADMKLIPIENTANGNRIVLVDDSIVRGVQTKNQTTRLKEMGAKEVHGRIACPPLMAPCEFGKTTKKETDCIARTMSVDEIRQTRGFDTLGYATIEDLEEAIGYGRDQLCLSCWDHQE